MENLEGAALIELNKWMELSIGGNSKGLSEIDAVLEKVDKSLNE